MPDVRILVSRCSRFKAEYGMRIEAQGKKRWVFTWAFPLKKGSAQREGYEVRSTISGTFEPGGEFPGCPHCKASGFFECACGRVACWDLASKKVVCPWCDEAGTLSGTLERLNVGSDR